MTASATAERLGGPQAVVNERQIVLAAEITNDPGDFSHLCPMIQSMRQELDHAGVTDRPEIVVADAGYWTEEHINQVICDEHLQVLIPPYSGKRKGPRRRWTGGLYDRMRHTLDDAISARGHDGLARYLAYAVRILEEGPATMPSTWSALGSRPSI